MPPSLQPVIRTDPLKDILWGEGDTRGGDGTIDREGDGCEAKESSMPEGYPIDLKEMLEVNIRLPLLLTVAKTAPPQKILTLSMNVSSCLSDNWLCLGLRGNQTPATENGRFPACWLLSSYV
jgi:hypothetical protein